MVDKTHEALAWRPNRWIGDPPILLDLILEQVEAEQAKQAVMMFLDAAVATQEANLRFVQGVRSLVAGGAAKR